MNDARNSGERFVAEWRANADRLRAAGVYDESMEHAACGVGFIASSDGQPSRRVVEAGIQALQAVWHRGAVDADGKTGDGAGIQLQVPQDFFRAHVRRTGHEPADGPIAVGMVFLPRTDFAAQETCRTIVETEVINAGYLIYGWRQVPVDTSLIGEKANTTRPEIEQIMIAAGKAVPTDRFERDLYVIRRRIEKQVLAASITEFYICSLSCRKIVYKGMFLAEQLSAFYPDLLDSRFVSSFAIFHQRYSTNTFPTWRLAQPFRMLAHNGEINTLKGNVNWMKSHEIRMASEALGQAAEDVKPIVQPGSSDSAALDAVFELLVQAGRSAPMAKTLLIPEAWRKQPVMPESWRAMYAYCNAVMEPWDGPAAIAATDGTWVIAGMDRNGLRPLRYAITRDGLVFCGSETGMVPLPEQDIAEKGRVGPGQMLAVDLANGRVYHDGELKDLLAGDRPFQDWVQNLKSLNAITRKDTGEPALFEGDELRRRQVAAGLTHEELELILHPMVAEAKEAVGSMGDDTPLAVLSGQYRGLHHFFRQQFSQVTNPPIDSLREYGVMTLKTRFGNLGNVLAEVDSQLKVLELDSPVLSNREFDDMRAYMGSYARVIDCTFPPAEGDGAMRAALQRIAVEAEDAVRSGAVHLILTDEAVDDDRAAVPMILAVGGAHTHLVKSGLRTFTSLNVRVAECPDVHAVAVLIGVGATTVNPYLILECVRERQARGLFGDLGYRECVQRYRKAVDQGLLKIMSKMGIGVLSSYRGAYNFEAVGLSRTLVAAFFPGMPSRISGIGLHGIRKKVTALHARAFAEDVAMLPIGGLYRYRGNAEVHGFEGTLVHMLQEAVNRDSYQLYREYTRRCAELPPVNLRDLMEFKPLGPAVPVDEVVSITEIRKRFVTGAMSHGALSKEAHETLAIAMNRIGAKSDSGEGGEDPARFSPRENGDNASSAIKQIASGRFGVTAAYLNKAEEIEIKIAQGAKPGEGGQLPGFKVTAEIARLRLSTPGVSLISPPPHHDIYSIEDLAQLIYDLKQINPTARVCVKLVAESGIGTIATGVVKAKADVIMVSGHAGGTGASPQSSIKYAGVPWEMGLTETNQLLTLNRLRHTARLRVDGGIKTGRDVVMAAMMGAEEFGIGTASLVAMGCIMVRQCHSNTCPVGVCTQDEKLRAKFTGTAEKVVNLFSFIAEEVREILASLGARSLTEVIGRTDMLAQVSRGSPELDDLDFNPLLVQADAGGHPRYCTVEGRNEVPESLDAQMIGDATPLFRHREKMQLTYNVRNTHRAVGTKLSGQITRTFGMHGLQPGHVTVRLRGSAGQSLGAFAVQGLRLEVLGDANDYVGKGLSGGDIVVRPTPSSRLQSHRNAIVGNTVLYGATAGTLFAAGTAGERFAVRNSGADAVVEGCGANGCEYMTGGTVVVLGPVGDNFAAGMTGGMAFVYDAESSFHHRVNADSVLVQPVRSHHWAGVLHDLVQRHAAATQSAHAAELLATWDTALSHFVQVCPREMLDRLAHPLDDAPRARRA
jgi:glutamate synthase (NADPH/NADH) large chain